MKTITKTIQLYKYNELNEEAKENAKNSWINDCDRSEELSDIYNNKLENIENFNDSTLELQFSLSYCQGDGLNIYGSLDLIEILNKVKKDFNKNELQMIKRLIEKYQVYNIELPYNQNYSYCYINHIDLLDEFDSSYNNYNDMSEKNEKVLKKLENSIIEYFENLCKEFEKFGYEFSYDIDDEYMENLCGLNEFTFLENGTMYNE